MLGPFPRAEGQNPDNALADGKILWVRSLTCHDSATAEDRKASAEVFAELDPLVDGMRSCEHVRAR